MGAATAVGGELAITGGAFPTTALALGAVLLTLGTLSVLRRRAA
jgi:hypothetical protein